MKKIFKPTWLPLFTLLAGAAGFGLRLWLFQSGIDHKGLLMADHPAGDLTFILTGIVLAVLALCVRTLMPMSLLPGVQPLLLSKRASSRMVGIQNVG